MKKLKEIHRTQAELAIIYQFCKNPRLKYFLNLPIIETARLKRKGFSTLYIRKGECPVRYVDSSDYDNLYCIQIASVEVRKEHEGKGKFRRLIKEIQKTCPTVPIIFEQVSTNNNRMMSILERLGCRKINKSPYGPRISFILFPSA